MGAVCEAEAEQHVAAEEIPVGHDITVPIEQLEIYADPVCVRPLDRATECRIPGQRSPLGRMITIRDVRVASSLGAPRPGHAAGPRAGWPPTV